MEGGKMSSRKIFGLILALMLGLLLIPLDSQAIDFVWSRTDDGFWDASGNWTPNGVPGSSPPREDTVTIDAAPARNVTVLYQGYSLGGVPVAGLAVNAGDTLYCTYNLGLDNLAKSVTVVNNGTITLGTDGESFGALSSGQSTVNLTGSGNLILGPDKRNVLTNGGWGGTFINQAPHIIRGAGEIDFWLTNQSQIIAENGTFYIAATIYNTGGTMAVNGPGNAFHLLGAVISGGQILAGEGQVILDRVLLSNLTLGPGAVTQDPHSLQFNRFGDGVSLPAGTVVTVGAGPVLNLGTAVHDTDPSSTIVNHGVIQLTGGGAQLNSRNARLSGTGRVVLGGDLNNLFTGSDYMISNGYFPLENGAGHTIEGGGTLVFKNIANNGAITANNGSLRIITASSGSQISVTGTGTITVAPNASLEAGGLIYSGGGGVDIACLTTNNGTLAANNGVLRLYASVLGGGQITVADNCTLELYNQALTGSLSMSPLASVKVEGSNHGFGLSGNFTFAQTDPAKWNWGANTGIVMGGNGDWQSLEVGSQDLGAVPAGFTKNFSLSAFELWNLTPPSVARAYLTDQVDNGHRAGQREALYVNSLWVDPGTTLNLNHLRLYTYLNGSVHQVQAGEGALFGGGQIINQSLKPVTAPVNSLLLLSD